MCVVRAVRIVCLGEVPAVWPEPVGSWIELEQVQLQRVTNVYEAAAAVRGAVMLLVDPQMRLMDLERLKGFGVPRFYFPGKVRHISSVGVESWEEALRFFEQLPERVRERKVVTPVVEDRYDAEAQGPVLSDEEFRALVGAAE